MKDKTICFVLGIISMLTPWLCVLGVLSFPPSISSLHYTSASILLYAPLIVSGVLLIIYKGNSKFENILTTIAGCAAFCICIFPCSNDAVNFTIIESDRIGLFHLSKSVTDVFHTLSASLFFSSLSFSTCVLSDDNDKTKNIIYRICGLCAIATMYLQDITGFTTWIIEMLAMTLLGVAWVVKSGKADFILTKIKKTDKIKA